MVIAKGRTHNDTVHGSDAHHVLQPPYQPRTDRSSRVIRETYNSRVDRDRGSDKQVRSIFMMDLECDPSGDEVSVDCLMWLDDR